MKKWILRLVTLLCLGLAGFGAFRYWRSRPLPSPTYKTVAVSRGEVLAQVTASGTLSALVTVLVGSQVSGRVSELFADFNTQVKKGQVLVRLDPQLLQATVAREHANLAQAKASLVRSRATADSAKRQADRIKALFDEKLATPVELEVAVTSAETARADVLVAQAGVEQAAASVHQAQINLAYATVRSPVDGVVISRSVDVGQTVAASLSAPTLFTIAGDLRQMQVDSNVAEADVGKLRPGITTTFTVDAYPTEIFRGTVREVRNAPQTVQSVVTYDAVIDVSNPDLKLKPGMTANVKFIFDRRDGALRVPNSALRFRPPTEPVGSERPAGASSRARPAGSGRGERGERGEKGERGERSPDRKTVYVLRGTELVRVSVRVGLTDGTQTEIVEGNLAEGDQVVVEATMPDAVKGAAPTGTPPGGAPRGGGMRL